MTGTIPKLENCGQYLARDNKGQWHYVNHAGQWVAFQGPHQHSPNTVHVGWCTICDQAENHTNPA